MRKLACVAFALGAFTAACGGSVEVTGSSQGGSGSGPGGGGSGGVAGGGASGHGGTGGSGGTEPVILYGHDYYVQKIHPTFPHSCIACHALDSEAGAAFLDFDPEVSYVLSRDYPGILAGSPAKSLLMLKPVHEGPALTDVQRELVTEWINLELVAPGDKSQPANLLSELAGCMDIDLWLAAGMDEVGLQQTNEAGQCVLCHSNGLAGAWFSDEPATSFEMSRQFPFIMRYVAPIYMGNDAVDLTAAGELVEKGMQSCKDPGTFACHPEYTLTPENQAAIDKFVDQSLTKFHDKACGP